MPPRTNAIFFRTPLRLEPQTNRSAEQRITTAPPQPVGWEQKSRIWLSTCCFGHCKRIQKRITREPEVHLVWNCNRTCVILPPTTVHDGYPNVTPTTVKFDKNWKSCLFEIWSVSTLGPVCNGRQLKEEAKLPQLVDFSGLEWCICLMVRISRSSGGEWHTIRRKISWRTNMPATRIWLERYFKELWAKNWPHRTLKKCCPQDNRNLSWSDRSKLYTIGKHMKNCV